MEQSQSSAFNPNQGGNPNNESILHHNTSTKNTIVLTENENKEPEPTNLHVNEYFSNQKPRDAKYKKNY